MDNFYKWLELKEYGIVNCNGIVFIRHINVDNSLTIDEPTKQMLIGYMIEFLIGINVIPADPEFITDIEDYYFILKKQIEFFK